MLEEIFKKYECDKGSSGLRGPDKNLGHGYHTVYEKYFASKRLENLNFLEVGIWKGTSHLSWIDYFPNSMIYGIDNIIRKNKNIFKKERFKYIQSSSMDKSLINKIYSQWGMIQFDFIIDDGLHTHDANRKTFNNLFQLLKPGGIYFIEDVYYELEPEKLEQLLKTLNMAGEVFHCDLRTDDSPDSYILGVIKK